MHFRILSTVTINSKLALYFTTMFGIPCSTSTDTETESPETERAGDPGRFTVLTITGKTALFTGVLLGF